MKSGYHSNRVSISAVANSGVLGNWKALSTSTHFDGKALRFCFETIHRGIIDVWNFRDDDKVWPTADVNHRMNLFSYMCWYSLVVIDPSWHRIQGYGSESHTRLIRSALGDELEITFVGSSLDLGGPSTFV